MIEQAHGIIRHGHGSFPRMNMDMDMDMNALIGLSVGKVDYHSIVKSW